MAGVSSICLRSPHRADGGDFVFLSHKFYYSRNAKCFMYVSECQGLYWNILSAKDSGLVPDI